MAILFKFFLIINICFSSSLYGSTQSCRDAFEQPVAGAASEKALETSKRFSIRSVFLATTLSAVLMGGYKFMESVHQHETSIRQIEFNYNSADFNKKTQLKNLQNLGWSSISDYTKIYEGAIERDHLEAVEWLTGPGRFDGDTPVHFFSYSLEPRSALGYAFSLGSIQSFDLLLNRKAELPTKVQQDILQKILDDAIELEAYKMFYRSEYFVKNLPTITKRLEMLGASVLADQMLRHFVSQQNQDGFDFLLNNTMYYRISNPQKILNEAVSDFRPTMAFAICSEFDLELSIEQLSYLMVRNAQQSNSSDNSLELLHKLLFMGADPFWDGNKTFYSVMKMKDPLPSLEMLLTSDIYIENSKSEKALMAIHNIFYLFVSKGNIEGLKIILRYSDFDFHEVDERPLRYAIQRGQPDVAAFLIELGADPEIAAVHGN